MSNKLDNDIRLKQSFDQVSNKERGLIVSKPIDIEVDSTAHKALNNSVNFEHYRISDHYKSTSWFNIFPKIWVFIKDKLFIYSKKGEISDHQKKNRQLEARLKIVEKEMEKVNTFIGNLNLPSKGTELEETVMRNWPKGRFAAQSLDKLALLEVSKDNLSQRIEANKLKISGSQREINRRELDAKISGLERKLEKVRIKHRQIAPQKEEFDLLMQARNPDAKVPAKIKKREEYLIKEMSNVNDQMRELKKNLKVFKKQYTNIS